MLQRPLHGLSGITLCVVMDLVTDELDLLHPLGGMTRVLLHQGKRL